MEIIYLLVLLSLLFLVVAGLTFYWAVHAKQFDNLEVEAVRILYESQ